jgi:hypothetical protein
MFYFFSFFFHAPNVAPYSSLSGQPSKRLLEESCLDLLSRRAYMRSVFRASPCVKSGGITMIQRLMLYDPRTNSLHPNHTGRGNSNIHHQGHECIVKQPIGRLHRLVSTLSTGSLGRPGAASEFA